MNKRSTIGVDYFEQLYASEPDPWRFRSSEYERTKYRATIDALGCRHFEHGLEVGCANGVLTKLLSAQCDTLSAVDISPSAVSLAREECRGLANIKFQVRDFLSTRNPVGQYDLIVLSEVVYYWDDQSIVNAARIIGKTIRDNGILLMIHWTGETDYPQTGHDAVHKLQDALGQTMIVERCHYHTKYRLDLWRHISRKRRIAYSQ